MFQLVTSDVIYLTPKLFTSIKEFHIEYFILLMSNIFVLYLAIKDEISVAPFERNNEWITTLSRQHGSAEVVRPKHQVDGKPWTLTRDRICEPRNINTKNCRGHYVVDLNTCAKFCYDRSTPFPPTDRWKCQPKFFLPFPSLPYFILAHLQGLNAWTDFYVRWLKIRGSA